MDVRRRISFNMSTGGGQPTEPSTGGTYTVNLNGQWEATTAVPNPDSTLYDGVYRSSSNYNVDSGVSIMYIDISGLNEFTLYIRSYAESTYDYVMVSQLDKTITSGSSTTVTTSVKAHTKGNQKSGTTISDYTEVKYTNIDGGSHRITILYRKDGSFDSGDDRGYVLISKNNGNSGSGGDTSGPVNTDNYMTILALENGLTASLSTNACQYCIDGDGNWIDLPSGTTTQAINQGQTLSFKGNLTPNSSSGIGTFTISKNCNLEGNCMSLLFGDDAPKNNSLSGKAYAFRDLFSGCTTIIQVSESFLPATTLPGYCYYHMFHGCSSLTTAPELPATTLAVQCYYSMFEGCSSLTTAPSILPATTLADYCYQHMFNGCINLVTAPELPATTLAVHCYYSMFEGCSSLVTAPSILPATTLAVQCYDSMFYGCSSLVTAPELPATKLATYCYYSMFYGCSSLVTAPELPATTLAEYCYRYMFYGCSSLVTAPELPATKLATYCYYSMFHGCSSLTTAPELPATTLAGYCYYHMFHGCSSLTTAPELPATKLTKDCYFAMFYGCSSLVAAPELPATTLADSCYYAMFRDCTNLVTAPELPATTLGDSCYNSMFYNCTNLTTASELSATTLTDDCYSYMFYDCSSLTTAPELPATSLRYYCYYSMFYGCSKLNYIKMLATDISAGGCLNYWVSGVASTGTFVKNPAMSSLPTGNSGIPRGWTVENDGGS